MRNLLGSPQYHTSHEWEIESIDNVHATHFTFERHFDPNQAENGLINCSLHLKLVESSDSVEFHAVVYIAFC